MSCKYAPHIFDRLTLLLITRVSPASKFTNLSVTECPITQGQVHRMSGLNNSVPAHKVAGRPSVPIT
jgi:hypothetical protein